jgi:hypothetical protein
VPWGHVGSAGLVEEGMWAEVFIVASMEWEGQG